MNDKLTVKKATPEEDYYELYNGRASVGSVEYGIAPYANIILQSRSSRPGEGLWRAIWWGQGLKVCRNFKTKAESIAFIQAEFDEFTVNFRR